MDFESKIISREISQILWELEKTVGTAESCTGGRIAEAMIATPGASKYFKGGVVSYVDEIKERLLHVDAQVLEEQTAVCEEVAKQMVKGACQTLNTNYAIAATGFAGPTGGTKEIPVGTIWLACGDIDRQVTFMVQEDHGRDINLAIATNKAMQMFLDFLKDEQTRV
ncbi:competence protein [Prevotella sp. P3-120]|jgi:nicotinamide-nucleotide amidase|uniref:CinA family protein n=1 Tax=unclassified Prevotella TaxID=2638335 RepID=UPI000B96A443|nr:MULTISPECIES: CinA family protein [unclassified Prevotella]MBS7319363.1 CinA family protein [Prevotella sp.]MCI6460287.1 CinA family protein [Prevotella sp.]MCI7002237.1 CinA family protein [Prevotella sp.]MDY4682934.1 CinA family protein [Prevotella sp.]OYP39950.1 competence protein [Prevotella sp. P5-126]